MTKIDIGIAEQDRVQIAGGLKRLLADSYTLYLQLTCVFRQKADTDS